MRRAGSTRLPSVQGMLEGALEYRREFIHVFLEDQPSLGHSWTGWLVGGGNGGRGQSLKSKLMYLCS